MEDRLSKIKHYFPKNAKCPGSDEVCCKRTNPPTPIPPPSTNAKQCKEWGNGFQCTTLDKCQPDTFATLDKNLPMFIQNAPNGKLINSDLVPCDEAHLMCCKILPPEPERCKDGSLQNYGENVSPCPQAPNCQENWPNIACGIHNKNGIPQHGVTQAYTGLSSQEGEWPHVCILYHKGEKIGGASLIAPQVLVTAASKLE